jgi:hypothetical protein
MSAMSATSATCNGCGDSLTSFEIEAGAGKCADCIRHPERGTVTGKLNGHPPSIGGMRLTRIGDVKPRRITWFEENLIPRGMVTGLVAAGGTVKGLYGIHLGVKAALRGERSLYLCSEDALEYIVRPRFTAAGCDAMLAYALDMEESDGTCRNLRLPSELHILRAAIDEMEPRLVVIDPLVSHFDAGIDIGQNNEVREVLQPLIGLAGETGAVILPVYHLGKDQGRGALGSVAFEDACRCVITAARDDEDEDVRHVELTKANVGPTGYGRTLRIVEVPIEIDGETVGVAKVVDEGRSAKSVPMLLQRKKRPGPAPTQRESAREKLVEVLTAVPGGSVNAGETKKAIAIEIGISEKTVWRAFDQLRKEELAGAEPVKDDLGTILEWRWYAKPGLLLGGEEA